jgi:hypothetical protein
VLQTVCFYKLSVSDFLIKYKQIKKKYALSLSDYRTVGLLDRRIIGLTPFLGGLYICVVSCRTNDFQVMQDKNDFILVIWSNVTYRSCVIFIHFTVFEALGPIPGFCGCFLLLFTD